MSTTPHTDTSSPRCLSFFFKWNHFLRRHTGVGGGGGYSSKIGWLGTFLLGHIIGVYYLYYINIACPNRFLARETCVIQYTSMPHLIFGYTSTFKYPIIHQNENKRITIQSTIGYVYRYPVHIMYTIHEVGLPV